MSEQKEFRLNDKEIELVLHKINVILASEELTKKFRNKYVTDWELIKASVKQNLIKVEAIKFIHSLIPTVFKIGATLCMVGEIKKEYCDFVGDDLGKQDVIEIYDISTEMETGDSYQFFVSTTEYFPYASIADTIKVYDFLQSLK